MAWRNGDEGMSEEDERREAMLERWVPPGGRKMKLNVHASCVLDLGVGLGVVLRDSQENVVKDANKFEEGVLDVLAAEVLPLLFGIQMAFDLGLN